MSPTRREYSEELRAVRLCELFNSERGRGCDRVRLGDPRHALALCGWANIAVRLALDGNAYTLGEFEEEHRGWAIWCWHRTQPLNPVSSSLYAILREHEKEPCHQTLLRILSKHCDYIKGRRVLTNTRMATMLPEHILQLIATFITADKDSALAMSYVKRNKIVKNQAIQKAEQLPPQLGR